MFPIRDHNPSQQTPYVTYALILINTGVFVLTWALFPDNGPLARLYNDWAMIPARINAGQGYVTMLTSVFMHGGWFHLGFNMLFLWIFGDNLEEEFGHVGFSIFYLACGLAAGAAQYLSDPYSLVPNVGASGAIAGVMGAYLLLFPKAKVDVLFIFIVFFRVFAIPAWIMLGVWFGLQLFNGVATDVSAGGVAYWAHAGGFVIGFIFTVPLWLARGGTRFWQRNHGQPPHPVAKYKLSPTHIPKIRKSR